MRQDPLPSSVKTVLGMGAGRRDLHIFHGLHISHTRSFTYASGEGRETCSVSSWSERKALAQK
jgi:hypothetical protein